MIASIVLAALMAHQASPACTLLYPVAADEAAARRIANAAIANRPKGALPRIFDRQGNPRGKGDLSYTLYVERAETGDAWNVSVYPTARNGVRMVSPVYAMTIDRCSGTIIDFGQSW